MKKFFLLRHKLPIVAAVLAILLVLLAMGSACKSNPKRNAYKIKQGNFKASIIETGQLTAVQSRTINMPSIGWRYGYQFKITGLLEHGKEVEKGDSVIQIEKESVLKVLNEERASLEREEANLNKLKVQQQNQMKNLTSDLASNNANLELIRLQLEISKFEPVNKRKIKELELEKALVQKDKIESRYNYEKIIDENELRIQTIRLKGIKSTIASAEEALNKLLITSPIKGIIQLERNRQTKQMYKVGDQVHIGQVIAVVPDLTQMKVEAKINEYDISKVFLGQPVTIRLDAFPAKVFDAEVSYVGKLSHEYDNGSDVKVFDLEIRLKTIGPILKPGMTTSCELITQELENAIYVENECIFKDSLNYYVIPDREGKLEKTLVEIGPRNNLFTVLKSNLKIGQRLITFDEIMSGTINKK